MVGEEMKVSYEKKDIDFAMKLLDQMSVTGIHNAERVVAVTGILANGEEIKESGKSEEKKEEKNGDHE